MIVDGGSGAAGGGRCFGGKQLQGREGGIHTSVPTTAVKKSRLQST